VRVGVIGCGVIGKRRTAALPDGCTLTACFDPNQDQASKFADEFGGKSFSNLDALIESVSCDAVIVSATNSVLTSSAQACLNGGLHVLIEKPAARSINEINTLKVPEGLVVKIGFNHRFHPAFIEILKEIKSHFDDPIMYVRARYGNGARVGFDKEWRSNVELAGGGELLDQGVHVIDLASQLLADLEVKAGYSRTHYWDMVVDDNTWSIMSTSIGQTFSMHVSSSEWKNEFQFDVYTRNRKYVWSGLGRSYGPEKLTIYTMKPEMGPPDVEVREFPPEDNSWLNENINFMNAIKKGEEINGGLGDAKNALNLVQDIYENSAEIQRSAGHQGAEGHPMWWDSMKSNNGV